MCARLFAAARVAAVASVTVVGCRHQEPGPATEAPTPASSQDSAESESPGVPAIDAAHQMLPASTLAWAEASSPRRILDVVQRDEIAKRLPAEYASVAGGLQSMFGVDPLRAENLPELGIDPDAPIGAFVLDVEAEAIGAYVTLTDPSRFRDVVLRRARDSNVDLVTTSLGGAEILRDKWGRTAVIIRGRYAALLSSKPVEEGRDWAQVLATLEPAEALHDSDAFEAVLAVDAKSDGRFFVSPAGWTKVWVEEQRRRLSAWKQQRKDELEEQRRSGASVQRLEELEKMAQSERHWHERDEAEIEVVESIFGGVDAFGGTIQMGKVGPTFEARASMGPEALPRALLRNASDVPSLLTALDGRPLFVVSGNTEVATVIDLLTLMGRTEGQRWEAWTAEVREETGVDIDKQVRPLLTGATGFAVTLDGELKFEDLGAFPRSVGGAFVAELQDAKEARALLDRAAAKATFDGHRFKPHRRTGGYVLDVPRWRKVYATVAGKYFVVTTDPELPARLADGKPGSIASSVTPSETYAAMARENTALSYVSDLAVLGWLVWSTASMPPPMEVRPPGRPSAEVRRLRRELSEIDAQLDAAQQKAQVAEARRMQDLVEPFGMTVVTVTEVEEGFTVQGGQFWRADGVADLVETVARAARTSMSGPSPEERKVRELWERRMKIENELQALSEPERAQP